MKEPPEESLRWKKFTLKGDTLQVSDRIMHGILPGSSPDDSMPQVKVEAGEYEIRAVLRQPKYGRSYLTELIVLPLGQSYEGAELMGKVSVDHGMVVISDYAALMKGLHKFPDEYESYLSECNEITGKLYYERKFKGASQLFMTSGLGDGTYPVYKLVGGNKVIGLKVEFKYEEEFVQSVYQKMVKVQKTQPVEPVFESVASPKRKSFKSLVLVFALLLVFVAFALFSS